ncbi:MAG: carbon-nitrogen hydrolase family protein [Lachnospiraceae bacterium]|nr:carbon-nitrogen hydrolase family protein [Lachnospiraceae bacterium]
MSNKLIVASVQMDCVLYDNKANLTRAEELIADAAGRGARLIVVPELFNTGYRVEDRDKALAEPIPGETVLWMQRMAGKYDAYLVGAIIEAGEDGKLYDTAVAVGPEGCLGKHRKMHLWGDEDKRFAKGEDIGVIELPFAKIGLLICYEIGFPEMARVQVHKGADILIYTSAFGRARYYVWDTASRSRALENSAFVIASNRCGEDKDTFFGGLSRIVAPDTTILAGCGADGEGVACAKIDLDETARMRATVPYLRDMNKKLYINAF